MERMTCNWCCGGPDGADIASNSISEKIVATTRPHIFLAAATVYDWIAMK